MELEMPKVKAPKFFLDTQYLTKEDVRRKRAKKKLSIFLAKVSARVKMREEEVFRRLEGHPWD